MNILHRTNSLIDQMKMIPGFRYYWAYYDKDGNWPEAGRQGEAREKQLCLCLSDEAGNMVAYTHGDEENMYAEKSKIVQVMFEYVTNNMKKLEAAVKNPTLRFEKI
jgi:putative NADPH-quinone reductase